jgi:hypothetical protein
MTDAVHGGLTETEMRGRVVQLVFGGDRRRFDEFCDVLKEALPPNTAAVVRGSAVTGYRWHDKAPFDSGGPGTSDLDLTIVGGEILPFYKITGFFVPGIHTRPVSDDDPDIAPALTPLRTRLMQMVGRPVNIQGTRDWVMYMRDCVFGQPYLTLVGEIGDHP